MIPVLHDMPTDSFVRQVYFAYLVEGMALLGEAVAPELIEQAAMDAGMAVGPLRALDEVSLKLADEALHASMHEDHHHHEHKHDHGDGHGHEHTHDHDHGHSHGSTDLMPEPAVYVLEKMAHGFNRMGRTSGGGFYDYYDDGDDPELWDGLNVFARGSHKANPQDCTDRLMIIQSISAIEHLTNRQADARQAGQANHESITSFGFPKPGLIEWINQQGIDAITARANELAAQYGKRFLPPDSLKELAAGGSKIEMA